MLYFLVIGFKSAHPFPKQSEVKLKPITSAHFPCLTLATHTCTLYLFPIFGWFTGLPVSIVDQSNWFYTALKNIENHSIAVYTLNLFWDCCTLMTPKRKKIQCIIKLPHKGQLFLMNLAKTALMRGAGRHAWNETRKILTIQFLLL